MVKEKKKSKELWDASYSRGNVLNRTAAQRPGKKALPPLRIRGFLWERNRNSAEFMELGRYNRRLQREVFNQEERGGKKNRLQKRREASPARPAGIKQLKQLLAKNMNSC